MTNGQSQPNVVPIDCDDLGFDDLGCYGSTRNASPTLDRLAAVGIRFYDLADRGERSGPNHRQRRGSA